MNGLAMRYAAAWYTLSRDGAALESAAGELMGAPALWQALTSPAVRPREKRAVLGRLSVFDKNPRLLRFFQLLAERGRLSLLPEILKAVRALALQEENAAVCVMRCAHPPGPRQQEEISKMLCRLHHRDRVLLDVRVDPALLGGFVLEIEGVTYDKSVRGQLEALARHLQERRMV